MSFWDNFNASKHAFYQYSSSLRGKRLSICDVENALRDFYRWYEEFKSLRSEASAERNPAAQSALEKILSEISDDPHNSRINKLLELKGRLDQMHQTLGEKIERLERAIQGIEESLRHDYQKSRILVQRKGNAWKDLDIRIREKENKIADMKKQLDDMKVKQRELYSGR
jgi:chromosome segregation ATPase